jgi:predicted nucleic acid-binding protein
VDKSAWSRASVPAVAHVLSDLSSSGRLASCSIIDLEILYSARSGTDHAAIMEELAGLDQISIDQRVFDRAIEVQAHLARSGRHRLPIPDLVIAATAELNGLTVLHYDHDFPLIAEVTGQSEQWVVPPGSA